MKRTTGFAAEQRTADRAAGFAGLSEAEVAPIPGAVTVVTIEPRRIDRPDGLSRYAPRAGVGQRVFFS
ncbi:MAG: hypothetical protein CMJ18_27735 [Phycisphaeraceae bacterium]|nr:hypothetical protein [Phycisphaeraceae bacterium]